MPVSSLMGSMSQGRMRVQQSEVRFSVMLFDPVRFSLVRSTSARWTAAIAAVEQEALLDSNGQELADSSGNALYWGLPVPLVVK